jgi:hypothetical protein
MSVPFRRWLAAILGSTAVVSVAPGRVAGQGCEPIRFAAPVRLGGAGQTYHTAKEWRLTLAYRRLTSNQWFIGTTESGRLAPGGSPPIFRIHTVVADISHAFGERFSAQVSIPLSTGSFTRKWADNIVHTQTASGIGDVSLLGEGWLLRPRSSPRGNIAFGLGIKAPTGSHTRPSQFYLGSGGVDFPADQTIQPGDGGWGAIMQMEAFRQVTDRATIYGFGSYLANPRARSDVRGAPTPAPNSNRYWSVPDVYSARLGLAVDAFPESGLSLSLGARVDGIPVHDLIGGGDEDTIKRTAYIVYADPGLSFTRGRNNVTLSVPWRMKLNRVKSLLEQQPGSSPNAGGFAKYLVFASYARRL